MHREEIGIHIENLRVWLVLTSLPPPNLVINQLQKRGYICARLQPRPTGGYTLTIVPLEPPTEPNTLLIAAKGATRIYLNLARPAIGVEEVDKRELLNALTLLENIIKDMGYHLDALVAYYELSGVISVEAPRPHASIRLEGFEDELIPLPSLYSRDVTPHQLTQIDVKPLTPMVKDKVIYMLTLLLRREREKMTSIIEKLEEIIYDAVARIIACLGEKHPH